MADTKQMLVDSLRDRLYEEAVVNAAEQYCTPAEDGQIGAIEWIFACHQVEEGKLIQLLYLYVDLCEVPKVSQAHIAMLVAMTEIVPCKKEVAGTANVYYLGFYCFHDVESLAYLEISPDRVGESVQETIDMVRLDCKAFDSVSSFAIIILTCTVLEVCVMRIGHFIPESWPQ